MASNYTNRTIDLVAFHGVKPVGYAQLKQNLFLDTAGEVCAGIQKLVQRWLCIFLTPLGSQTFDTDRGTRFMVDIFSAGTENDIYTIFQIANSDTIDQLKNEETTDMPLDEKIGSVTLNSIELYLGSVSLYITIASKGGTSVNVILPIDINPLML